MNGEGIQRNRLLRLSDGTVDLANGIATRGDNQVALDAKELGVLKVLVAKAGQLVLYEEFCLEVWDGAAMGLEANVQTRVSSLRSKLGLRIRNVRTRGYILEEPLKMVGEVANQQESEVPQVPPGQPGVRPRRFRALWGWIGAVILMSGAVTAFYWLNHYRRQPDYFTIENKLLRVFDDQNRFLWEYSAFPAIVSATKVTSDHWTHKFLDIEGERHLILLTDKRLYCFDRSGNKLWDRVPGRKVVTKDGVVPADYAVKLVDALSHPRPDGGQIIMGSNRGPGALFMIELLTKDGRKVAEYTHFGWFFAMTTGTLADGECIFLTGVDSAGGDHGATLVVLSPNENWGQSVTEEADPRGRLIGVPISHEKAVLLIKDLPIEYGPSGFCTGREIRVVGQTVEVFVSHVDGAPGAHFRFNSRLQLEDVNPELIFLRQLNATILNKVPPDQLQPVLRKALGDIIYIRNEFN